MSDNETGRESEYTITPDGPTMTVPEVVAMGERAYGEWFVVVPEAD